MRGMSFTEESKTRIEEVFGEEGIQEYCVFLINETGDEADEMVVWLLSHPYVLAR